MKLRAPLSIFVCMAVALVACGGGEGTTAPDSGEASDGPSGSAPTEEDGSEDPVLPAGPRTVTVEMRGISYHAPGGGDFVTIQLGERIRWINRDGTLHTATSTSVPVGAKGFNSGHIPPGGEYVFTPTATGTWEYACLQYPGRMSNARIRVVE